MKKGTTHLDSEIEYIIGSEILNTLKYELKLLLPSAVPDSISGTNSSASAIKIKSGTFYLSIYRSIYLSNK
jgi:hypothetical protein